MQTYGNFISSQSYRPHLDSVDFIKFLRVSVIVMLILAMAFSIRGNFKGLTQTLERDVFWLVIISLAITGTSSFLSMVTVIKIKGLKIVSRVLIGCVAVGLFYISTRLTFIGFVTGEKSQVINAIQENPELVQAKAELQNIITRQNEYGMSQSEKQSLMAREKEQRGWIREIEKRLIVENRNSKSNLENAIGAEKRIAMTLFALGPELCIAVLSPLVVLLFGAGCGVVSERRTEERSESEHRERIVYVPIRENAVEDHGNGVDRVNVQPQRETEAETTIQNSQGNGAAKQIQPWNPFQ